MGDIIAASAAIEDIDEAVTTSYGNALARKGDVGTAAETRLGPSVTFIRLSKDLMKSASDMVDKALSQLIARDDESDLVIGAVRDALYNHLKRPKSHPVMDTAFPGGVATYAHGDPRKQHILMGVLVSRLKGDTALPKDRVEEWAGMIETHRLAQEEVAKGLEAAEAAETIAIAGYRAAVRSGLIRLRDFKRDLKSLGLTEAQIHEIIPDAGRSRKPANKGAGKDEPGKTV